MRVGVIGGTFDPIHYGHLILAEQAAGYFNLSKVLFMPSNTPPHKDIQKVASVKHRIEMITLAIENNDLFEISAIESEREEKSYSYKTFELLSGIYEGGTEFYFITGSDVLCDLHSFKNLDELVKRCSFVVAVRPGADMARLTDSAEQLRSSFGAKIHIAPFQEIGISSTIIKEKVRSNESVRYMLPDKVKRYIETNGLYKL